MTARQEIEEVTLTKSGKHNQDKTPKELLQLILNTVKSIEKEIGKWKYVQKDVEDLKQRISLIETIFKKKKLPESVFLPNKEG